jgi:hypothetical protein
MKQPGPKLLIVVAGNAHAGKDSLADRIAASMSSCRRDAFAAPLKECVHLKTGIPMDVLNGPPGVKNDPQFGRYGQTPRKLMQDEGQEARDRIAKTVWMDRLVERAQSAQERCTIVSDGRHPQEEIVGVRASLDARGTFLGVRVVRPGEPVLAGHPSEDKIAAAPDSLFDVIVCNDSTLDDLALAARQVADLVILRAKTGGRKKAPEGWIVGPSRADGYELDAPILGRYLEPFADRAEAETLAAKHACRGCPVEPVSYDRIEII